MAVELNLAQTIGYSVQVLLILALLVALSIRSWMFLIAIVLVGMIALVLACFRASHDKKIIVKNEKGEVEMVQCDKEDTQQSEEEEEERSVPGPPEDIESLRRIRPVSLMKLDKPGINETSLAQPSSGVRISYDTKNNSPVQTSLHQENPQSQIHSSSISHTSSTNQMNSFGQPSFVPNAHAPSIQASHGYPQPTRPYPQSEVQPSFGYVSHLTQRGHDGREKTMEDVQRAIRWQHLATPRIYHAPLKSIEYAQKHFGHNSVYRPDPNKVFKNPGAWRRYIPNELKPKQSSWATGSYLYK